MNMPKGVVKSEGIKKKAYSERKEAWFRIIVLIISGIILHFWGALVCVLGVINWFIAIFANMRNKEIAEFCEYWNTEKYKFIRYLTSVTNERPFPFSSMERFSRFE